MTEDMRYRHLFHGILSVVDIDTDPHEVFSYLKGLYPPAIDFLLPHGNWQDPPKGLETWEGRLDRPYARWMKTIFNEWFPQETLSLRIRTFDSIVHLLSNGRSNVESIGGEGGSGLVVIETDGSYELVDTLKSTPGRVSKIGKNVRQHSIHEASAYMARRAKQLGTMVLADECQTCPVKKACGGGYAPHRYSKEKGFNNRSAFCFDLADMLTSIHGALMQHTITQRIMAEHENTTIFPWYPDFTYNLLEKNNVEAVERQMALIGDADVPGLTAIPGPLS